MNTNEKSTIIIYKTFVKYFIRQVHAFIFLHLVLIYLHLKRKYDNAIRYSRSNSIYIRVRVNVLLTELYPTKEVLCEQSSNSIDFSLDIDDYLMAVQKMSIDGILDYDEQPPISNNNNNNPSNNINLNNSRLNEDHHSSSLTFNDAEKALSTNDSNVNIINNLSISPSNTAILSGGYQSDKILNSPIDDADDRMAMEMKENQLPRKRSSLLPGEKIKANNSFIQKMPQNPFKQLLSTQAHPVATSSGIAKVSSVPSSTVNLANAESLSTMEANQRQRKQYLSRKIILDDYIDDDQESLCDDKDETTVSSTAISDDDDPFGSSDINSCDSYSMTETEPIANSSSSISLGHRGQYHIPHSHHLSSKSSGSNNYSSRTSRKMHNSHSESDARSLDGYRCINSAKDVQLFTKNRIPYTYEHVASCSNEEFRQMRSTPGLNNTQINILVDARRRATNRQAAERCRRIKVIARDQLVDKLDGLKSTKNDLMKSIECARQKRLSLKDELYDEQKRLLSALTLESGRRLNQNDWRVHVSVIDNIDQPTSSNGPTNPQPTREVVIMPVHVPRNVTPTKTVFRDQ